MLLTTAPTLRTAAMGCRLQPTLLTPCTYHTSAPRKQTSPSPRSSPRRVSLPKRQITFPSIRHESTTISALSGAAETKPNLDWNTFFKLRKTRRWYQLGSSIGTGVSGFVGGAQILTHSDMDAVVSQIPLDPFITLGLITFTCGGVGWLLGPVLGTGIFNLQNRSLRGQMDEKEKEFYKRVKRFRVDPSASSMANPVPDYYGEKISSVAGYRQWLKDQRAFNKKRTTYIKY